MEIECCLGLLDVAKDEEESWTSALFFRVSLLICFADVVVHIPIFAIDVNYES